MHIIVIIISSNINNTTVFFTIPYAERKVSEPNCRFSFGAYTLNKKDSKIMPMVVIIISINNSNNIISYLLTSFYFEVSVANPKKTTTLTVIFVMQASNQPIKVFGSAQHI